MKIDIRVKLGKFEKKVKSFLNLEISFTEKNSNDTHAEQSFTLTVQWQANPEFRTEGANPERKGHSLANFFHESA